MPPSSTKLREKLSRYRAGLRRGWGKARHSMKHVRRGWGHVKRRIIPEGGLGAVDMALLRWGSLCAAVLVPLGLVMALGGLTGLDEWQLELLSGHPFYLGEREAQAPLLGPGGIFGLGTLVTFYLSTVLLREGNWLLRTHVCALAVVALALPGVLCVLWDGVLFMALPVLCVILLWGLTFIPFFHPSRHKP